MLRLNYVKTNPEKLEVFFVRNFKRLSHGFLSEKLRKVKVKSKQSDWQEGKSSKKLLEQVVSGFSQRSVKVKLKQKDRQGGHGSKKLLRNVKVKSKQSNRQGGQGSKKLLVKFSQGQLKEKTRLILDKSTTVGVFFSKNIKSLRQVKTLKGCVRVFSAKVTVKFKPSGRQEGKGSKKLLVHFTQG
ncbi:hypothetical protein M0802_014382 [Mischocyttarus mexicanus]|nr:hypothetical protein M0802_014382 [Mischocyttarus mexicanus]